MASSVPAIAMTALTKHYDRVVGIEGVTLEIPQGEVFGFLGANGSGKTTTIRTLLDLLRPTNGTAAILGFDCQRQGLEARRLVGYAPGEIPMYPELTGHAYLTFLSSLGRTSVSPERLTTLLRRFEMSDRDLGRQMRDYSHGMKRKLGLIQALMTDAPVLILDEPTSGFDPLMIEAFSETIDEIARAGRATVFLSSHVLSEVDRVCHRIGLLRQGHLVAVRTLSELRAATPRRLTVTFSRPVSSDPPPMAHATLVAREADRWVLDVHGPLGAIVTSLAGLPTADLNLAPFALEETILRLMEPTGPAEAGHGVRQAAS